MNYYRDDRSTSQWLLPSIIGVGVCLIVLMLVAAIRSGGNHSAAPVQAGYYYNGYNFYHDGFWYLYPPRVYGGVSHFYGPTSQTHVTRRVYITKSTTGTTKVTTIRPKGVSSFSRGAVKPTTGATSSAAPFYSARSRTGTPVYSSSRSISSYRPSSSSSSSRSSYSSPSRSYSSPSRSYSSSSRSYSSGSRR